MLEDTIIAVSTPPGFGGLGIVRLSGPRTQEISLSIFRPRSGTKAFPSRRLILGHIYDEKTGETFDEAYLTFFPAPHSYTTEDVAEISCHGSPVILEETVRLGLQAGARHAHPGEFTLRAFLGGRVDILQAEAVNDLITAPSLRQAKLAFRQMEGSLSRVISRLRDQIIHTLSQIEASIEFPDEELHISPKIIAATIRRAKQTVSQLVDSYDLGKTLSEGLVLAIAGRTNVGKSTLFNAFLNRERAIVTPHPGTTRDYLQETMKIRDSLFTLVDMAGLSKSAHPVEKAGIRKGKQLTSAADGILLMLDVSRRDSPEDLSLLSRHKDKNTLLVFNKIDLPEKLDRKKILRLAGALPQVDISALTGKNIDRLKDLIASRFAPGQDHSDDVILHLRQKLLLQEIQQALTTGLQALEAGFSEEIFAEEIRKTLTPIGRLTGEIRTDHVLEDIFKRFCIGK